MLPRELIDKALQVLKRHLVVDADEAPLQQCPEAFNTVCMRLAAHILTHGVVHCLVRPVNPLVGAGLVRVERRTVCVRRDPFTKPCNVVLSAFSTTCATTFRVARSLMPATAVLPTAPRPALSFFLAYLFLAQFAFCMQKCVPLINTHRIKQMRQDEKVFATDHNQFQDRLSGIDGLSPE